MNLVPQAYIVVGSDEIKEVIEYIYLGLMVNMCQDMDTE